MTRWGWMQRLDGMGSEGTGLDRAGQFVGNPRDRFLSSVTDDTDSGNIQNSDDSDEDEDCSKATCLCGSAFVSLF